MESDLRVASIAVVIAFLFIRVIFTLRIMLWISSPHPAPDPAFPSFPARMKKKKIKILALYPKLQ